VQASNAGGVTTLRTGTTAPLAHDTAPPASAITALRCRLQTCTLSIAAADPHAVPLTPALDGFYAVAVKCHKRRKAHPHTLCHRTATITLAVKALAANAFHASASRLPYGERIKFAVLASNAAGLRQARPALRYATLHKPRPRRRRTGTH